MLKLTFLVLFVLGSIQATVIPQTVQVHRIVQNVGGAVPGDLQTNGNQQTKTYTLPDGTVVHEVFVQQGNKKVIRKEIVKHMSTTEIAEVRNSLGKMPRVTIKELDEGSNIATIPAQQLLIFLNQQGLQLPSEITQIVGLGKDPNALITIYLDQLFDILADKDKFSKVPAGRVIYLLKKNPSGNGGQPVGNGGGQRPVSNGGGQRPVGNGGDKVPGSGANLQVKGSHTSLVNNGNSYLANTGINRRQICDRGLVDQTATAIRSTVNGAVGSIADALGSGALGAVGHGASALITHAISGVDFAIQDAACGLGNIADEIASALDNGDIIGGVGKVGQEFFGGLANMAEDLVSEAGAGVGQAANDIFGFLQDIGK